jgi:hypothetical protein
MIGGIVQGIGMALLEESVVHPRVGTFVSPNLSGYLVPVHADVPDLDVLFVPEEDPCRRWRASGTAGAGGPRAALRGLTATTNRPTLILRPSLHTRVRASDYAVVHPERRSYRREAKQHGDKRTT